MKLKFICIFLLGAFVCFKNYERQQTTDTTTNQNTLLVNQQTRSVNGLQVEEQILSNTNENLLHNQNN